MEQDDGRVQITDRDEHIIAGEKGPEKLDNFSRGMLESINNLPGGNNLYACMKEEANALLRQKNGIDKKEFTCDFDCFALYSEFKNAIQQVNVLSNKLRDRAFLNKLKKCKSLKIPAREPQENDMAYTSRLTACNKDVPKTKLLHEEVKNILIAHWSLVQQMRDDWQELFPISQDKYQKGVNYKK